MTQSLVRLALDVAQLTDNPATVELDIDRRGTFEGPVRRDAQVPDRWWFADTGRHFDLDDIVAVTVGGAHVQAHDA